MHKNIQNRGAILIIVMWISLALISLALLFGQSMTMRYKAVDNQLAGIQAEHVIEGARRYVAQQILDQENFGYSPIVEEDYNAKKLEVGNGIFWLLGRDENASDNLDSLTFSLVDEASKINLNSAPREILLEIENFPTELADAIIDWRDTNQDTSENGAESDYYNLNTPSYNAKNSAFDSIEELRLLNGIEWEELIGEDYNRNGILDENENDGEISLPNDDANGIMNFGWLEYFTVHSSEPNTQADGSQRTSIRNVEELRELLTREFGQERSTQIMARTGQNLQNISSILHYYLRSQIEETEFAQIEDKITISDEDTIIGRININTAQRQILRTIPGIGDEYADTIIATRLGKASIDLESISWITEVLPDENAIQAGPFITTRSYQTSADVVALGRNGKGFRRVKFVFNQAAEDEVVVIARNDLSRLGWPLGEDIRKELIEERNEN